MYLAVTTIMALLSMIVMSYFCPWVYLPYDWNLIDIDPYTTNIDLTTV